VILSVEILQPIVEMFRITISVQTSESYGLVEIKVIIKWTFL